jgi:uncharacterized membrane protein
MNADVATARRIALAAWLLLAACVLAWPFTGSRIGPVATGVAFLPLLLPLHGLVAGSPVTLRTTPMAVAPALAWALTEALVNPAARAHMAATLALLVAAFAAMLPVIRGTPRT